MGFNDRLTKMNSQWDDTASGFAELPEDLYTMQLVEATLKETANGGLRASIQYAVSEGEHSGQTIYDGFMLEKDGEFFEMGAKMLKSWIERMDYEVPELDELEDTLAQMTADAPMVYAEVKKKGEYTNVRVREKLGEGSAPAAKPKKQNKTTKKSKPAADCPFSVGDEVSFEDGDDTISGKITAIDGDNCNVLSDDEEDWEEIPFSDLTAEVDEEEVVAPKKAAKKKTKKKAKKEPEPEPEGEDTSELLAFAGSHDLEGIDDSMELDAIVEAINEYEWKAKELTEEEVDLLESVEIEVVKPKARASKAKKK